jgi:putative glycosyltransferase (TIGR04348 family)
MGSAKPVVCIVTPGTRTANNGNWRTAARWAGILRGRCKVIVQTQWDGRPADALVALHARRSAASVLDFSERLPGKAVAVMLTGTDLYRDLPSSREAARTLDLARRIVALQEDALNYLEPRWRAKAQVIFQSAHPLRAGAKAKARLDCVAAGHLRDVKDPRALFEAIRRLPPGLAIHVRHFGAPLDADLAAEAFGLQSHERRYRYHGAQPHGLVRAAIKAAHVLVHPSLMEGGANVVVEAVTSGTPVIASRISGNVGMLGARYPGYFEPGDASALSALLVRALREPAFLDRLRVACNARRKLFSPAAEARAVRRLVAELLA